MKRAEGGKFAGTPGPGRPKGSANKITADVRAMTLEALSKAGGVDYLVKQAEAQPVAFLALVGKCLPKEITGPGGAALEGATIIINPVAPKT